MPSRDQFDSHAQQEGPTRARIAGMMPPSLAPFTVFCPGCLEWLGFCSYNPRG
ncbi:MAG: hypothetical protein ACQESR_21385 [Planctomycetota bacterium]